MRLFRYPDEISGLAQFHPDGAAQSHLKTNTETSPNDIAQLSLKG